MMLEQLRAGQVPPARDPPSYQVGPTGAAPPRLLVSFGTSLFMLVLLGCFVDLVLSFLSLAWWSGDVT